MIKTQSRIQRKTLTLILPTLPHLDSEADQTISAPALQRFLSRGQCRKPEYSSALEMLSQIFGLDLPSQSDWPAAALTAQGLALTSDNEFWLCADPVYLHADLDRLVLTDPVDLQIELAEAEQLVEYLNETCADLGWRFHRVSNGRWIVNSAKMLDVATTDLDAALAAGDRVILPIGADARLMQKVLTEIQMLLHDHPVNQARVHAGKLPINSLWFWGGGVLPRAVERQPDVLITGRAFCQGLGKLANVAVESVKSFEQLSKLESASWVVVDLSAEDRLDSQAEFSPGKAIKQWERDWFAPIWQAMRAGEWHLLRILSPEFEAEIGSRQMKYFWKRPKRLSTILGVN